MPYSLAFTEGELIEAVDECLLRHRCLGSNGERCSHYDYDGGCDIAFELVAPALAALLANKRADEVGDD